MGCRLLFVHIVSLSFLHTYISKVREGFCSLKISARQALATYLLLNQSFNPRDFPESAEPLNRFE